MGIGAKFFAAAFAVALAGGAHAAGKVTYTYDALGRLVQSSSSQEAAPGHLTTIGYDKAGNRATYSVSEVTTISVGDVVVTEGSSLLFPVTLSGTTSLCSITFATVNGSGANGAVSPADFGGGGNTFNINPGVTTLSFTTAIDSLAEGSETMSLVITNNGCNAAIVGGEGVGTINDPGPVFTLSDANATEGQSIFFTLTLSGSSGPCQITIATVNGTGAGGAASPGDFGGGSNTFPVDPGTRILSYTTATDSLAEGSEGMKLVVSNPGCGATIADGEGDGTIEDPQSSTPRFRISDAAASEGGTLSFVVTLSGTTSSCAVSYSTTPFTAATTDYGTMNGRVTVAPGVSTLTVAANSDSVVEGHEKMKMLLSSPGCGVIADGEGIGTIRDL